MIKRALLNKLLLAVIMMVLFNMGSRAQAEPSIVNVLLSKNWNVGSEQEANFIAPSSEQILELFNELLPENWAEFVLGDIGPYELKDLNHDGIYEILEINRLSVVADHLSVICKLGNTIKVKHFEKSFYLDDLNGDGVEEILIADTLIYKTWTIGEGTVDWYDIYKWDGSEFKVVNDKFPEFYQKMIAEYNARIEKLRNEFDPYQRAQETDQPAEYWQEQRDKEVKACEKGIRKAGLVLAIPATIDLKPESLNLKSKGKWITCYIELQSDFNVVNINISTILLNDILPCEMLPTEIGDYDNNGLQDLMVKFDRDKLISLLIRGEITLTVTGKMMNGEEFSGTDVVKVISNNPLDLKAQQMQQTGSVVTIAIKNQGELPAYNVKITKVTTPKGIICSNSVPVLVNSPIQPGQSTSVNLQFNTTQRVRFGFEMSWEDEEGNIYSK